MHEQGENPQRQRPQPEQNPGQPDNTLEKSYLDFKNTAAILAALSDRQMAAEIMRLAESATLEQAVEEETPLHMFGIVIGSMRRKQKLTVENLAARSGLEPTLIYAIELGAASLEQVNEALQPLGKAFGDKYAFLSNILVRLSLNI